MSRGASTLDWGVLVPRLIHETKVSIIEAMQWLERPLSARELQAICGGEKSISTVEYHLLSLVEARGVAQVGRRRVRGARESRYFLTDAMRGLGHNLKGRGAVKAPSEKRAEKA
jgi:DNA-binding transcriptional ArsR family regulator